MSVAPNQSIQPPYDPYAPNMSYAPNLTTLAGQQVYVPPGGTAPSQSLVNPELWGQSTGSVLGTNTGGGNPPPTANWGGQTVNTSGFPGEAATGMTAAQWGADQAYIQQQIAQANQNQTNAINSGYDAYFNSLDQMMGGLGTQQTNQNQIIQNSATQGLSDLGASRTQSMTDLGIQEGKLMGNQAKNLRDLSDQMQNQYQAGNVYLGARGAGDSSAANQYGYALQKLGNRSRGDVMSQTQSQMGDIGAQRAKVNNIFTQETGRLDTEKSNQLLQVSNWFQQAQQQIQQAKATGQLSKGQDLANLSRSILDQAIQRLQTIDTNTINQKNALTQWAMNNSTTVQGLQQNFNQLGSFQAQLPQSSLFSNPSSQATGGTSYVPGSGGTRRKDMWDV